MKLVTDTKQWRAALSVDEGFPEFVPDSWSALTLPASPTPFSPTQQIVAEAYFFASSVIPRGALGGTFTPGGDTLEIALGVSEGPLGAPGLQSAFWGQYELGLPSEFSGSIMSVFAREAARSIPMAGELVLNIAGFDPRGSSDFAYSRAVMVLLWALQAGAVPLAPNQIELEAFARSMTIDVL